MSRTPGGPVLELSNVSRVYSSGTSAVTALADVSLAIDPGEFIAIMGPSGSGKSTLLGIAGGLDSATSGVTRILGQDLSAQNRDALARLRRRTLGFVFQDFNLVPTLTVVENIALPLELDGMAPKPAREHARAALARVGLSALEGRFIEQISGGQRQRIAIARAIIGERQLILADEPTGALDSRAGDEVMSLLRDLADDGKAVILVTHEARHAGWADRVIFLRDGRVIDESRTQMDPAALLAGA